MDKLSQYRYAIIELLSSYTENTNAIAINGLKAHAIFDEKRDRYMVFETGWAKNKRINMALLYVHLSEGKIWIEEDLTLSGLQSYLMIQGIPEHDIVSGAKPHK